MRRYGIILNINKSLTLVDTSTGGLHRSQIPLHLAIILPLSTTDEAPWYRHHHLSRDQDPGILPFSLTGCASLGGDSRLQSLHNNLIMTRYNQESLKSTLALKLHESKYITGYIRTDKCIKTPKLKRS